ncbi:MAG: hypothetical protein WC659_01560 [Patescibacteria group bacterium]
MPTNESNQFSPMPYEEIRAAENAMTPYRKEHTKARHALMSQEALLTEAGVPKEIIHKAALIAEQKTDEEWERRERENPLVLISEALDSIAETADEKVLVEGAKKRIDAFSQYWRDVLKQIENAGSGTVEEKIQKRYSDNQSLVGPQKDTSWRKYHEITKDPEGNLQMRLDLLQPENRDNTRIPPGLFKEKFLKKLGVLDEDSTLSRFRYPTEEDAKKGITFNYTFNGIIQQIPFENIHGVRADVFLGYDDPGAHAADHRTDQILIYLNTEGLKKELHQD